MLDVLQGRLVLGHGAAQALDRIADGVAYLQVRIVGGGLAHNPLTAQLEQFPI